jgi:hypothetical protein
MKASVNDIGCVREIEVMGFASGNGLIEGYQKEFRHQTGFMGSWIPPHEKFPAIFWRRLARQEWLEPFTVKIISYTPPVNPTHGLERRQATAMLRSLNLRPPTTQEVFQAIANSATTDFALFTTIQQNACRNLVALTPFHPEVPTFLQMHATLRNDTSFTLEDHHDCGLKGRLFFYEHSPRRKFMDPTAILINHFPLLLGIAEGK